MYIKLDTNQVFTTHSEIRLAFPNMSFPPVITDELLAEHGVFVVNIIQPTEIDTATQTSELGSPVFNAEANRWEATYTVRSYTEEETAQQALKMRQLRDKLLAETDWVTAKAFEAGTSVPTEWQVYRQALRDVPTQAEFPYAVTWPSKP
jgi:hypothetical protein